MEPGYSKVLLHESVINAIDPYVQSTASDLTMMMACSAAERTEAAWNDLLASAGLKPVKIWSMASSHESVIEAILV